MNIRQATKNDEDLIKQIHKESKKEIGSFDLFFVWSNYLKGKTTYKYYIIDDVGFVRFGYSKKYSSNVIYDIAILIKNRNQGYGKKIISRLPKPFILKCNTDNESGNAFYKSAGMKHCGIVKSKNAKKEMNLWAII